MIVWRILGQGADVPLPAHAERDGEGCRQEDRDHQDDAAPAEADPEVAAHPAADRDAGVVGEEVKRGSGRLEVPRARTDPARRGGVRSEEAEREETEPRDLEPEWRRKGDERPARLEDDPDRKDLGPADRVR